MTSQNERGGPGPSGPGVSAGDAVSPQRRTEEETPARTVSSQVTVPVDPATAFSVFTEEINLWWVRGPVNFYDATRAVAMRCEPGVGGRLLEVYDDEAGEALELGRITTWQPGELVGWQSSVDDVSVEVELHRRPAREPRSACRPASRP